MNGFNLRILAYHGAPFLVGNVPTRSVVSHNEVFDGKDVVNDLSNVESTHDKAHNEASDYNIDALISDFQDEYGCKVNLSVEPEVLKDGTVVHEFDIFEPSWPDQVEAEDTIEDLKMRLTDWINGYPTGY